MISLSLGLSCIGFILLSLSLKRHFQQVFSNSSNFKRWLLPNRIAGYTFVSIALLPCILLRGPWIGIVLWLSILAAAAFTQAMLLTYSPQRTNLFASLSLLLMVIGLST